MKIGIQISSSLENRTGVEEYIYQLLKHLPMVDDYKNHQFFIYGRKNLKWPFKFGWTQIRLSWEMLKNSPPLPKSWCGGKPDILFVPAHTYPLIHPGLVVAIQGLEFEAVPKMYGWLKRKILRFLTKRNAKKVDKIIVPSLTTKNDLIKYYRINPNKIFVVYHGVDKPACNASRLAMTGRYILYLGSGHKRKNIEELKKAFKILKEKYPPASPASPSAEQSKAVRAKRGGRGKIPHKLILAGTEGYVSEQEKWQLIKNADVFVYPSFYEGFGMPVLEAQKVGVPVVASNTGALPEILGNSALLVNPENPSEIAEAIYKIIKNPELRENLIRKGYENIKRFNWLNCAKETLRIISQN
ncbi:MAG: glycosyltransferase family 4 protein [Patescibacteria group bacterium]